MKKLLLSLIMVLLCGGTARAAVITVNTDMDYIFFDGKCSLREAIYSANNNRVNYPDCIVGEPAPIKDEIRFQIPGDGVRTIKIFAELPALTELVLIDGLSQFGASCAPRNLLIELDGSNAGSGVTGLALSGESMGPVSQDKTIIRGLAINGFSQNGIRISSPGQPSEIYCNHIGTDAAGLTAKPNGSGVLVSNSLAVIGGDNPEKMNVISGNLGDGVRSFGDAKVYGNHIGVDVTGTNFIPNQGNGLYGDWIGSITAVGNIIAGNLKSGVVGVDHVVGYPTATVLNNSIYANQLLGIDLNDDGVTLNDENDVDQGGNYLLNYPDLVFAGLVGSNLVVQFSLDVQSPIFGSEKFHVEFFSNPSGADSSGHGEGEIYLGYADVMTDSVPGSTTHTAVISVPADALDSLQNITATATEFIGNPDLGYSDEMGATSEFSPVIQTSETFLDFGDAPDAAEGTGPGNYQTLLERDGAWHLINAHLYLGKCVDGDDGTLQDASAEADDENTGVLPEGMECASEGDDEDGLNYIMSLRPGDRTKMEVTVSDSSRLNVWIDFNHNGDWTDEGEHVVADIFLSTDGSHAVKFDVPQHAQLGQTYMRIRLSYESGLGPTGGAGSGEVEDYLIKIESADEGGDDLYKKKPVKWDPYRKYRK